MKQLFSMLLALALTLTGCASGAAATEPETQVPETATETAGTLQDYPLPQRFTGDWTGLDETYFVHADAEILLPEAERMVTARVRPRTFSQEEADKMMAVFLKGNTLYQEPVPTKAFYAEELEHYEAIARGEIPYDHDGTIDRVPEIIERLKQQLEAAPEAGQRFPAETTFHEKQYPEGTVGGDESLRVIGGYAQVDGRNIHCGFQQSDAPTDTFARFWEEGYGDVNGPNCSRGSLLLFGTGDEPPIQPSISEEQAARVGDKLMEDLGLSDFTLDSATPVSFGGNLPSFWYNETVRDPVGETGYDLLYVRNVGGLPLTRTTGDGSATEDNAPFLGSWADERVRVLVTEDRVVWFEWSGPYTQPEILAETANLVPFDQIQEVFAKMIFVKNEYWRTANRINGFNALHDVAVDKVQLTLMRTRPKGSLAEGTIIPVWDFWATTSARAEKEADRDLVYEGKRYEVVLTINALDGTMVDRELGY